MNGPVDLPRYKEAQFENPPLQCDAIMKGGVTSGIVYPYAILEIATKYRFRSLGGTSAGAIAAAFAAAAEYSRSVRNDATGFLRLQAYCDRLPAILPSLFQPDPEFRPALRLGIQAVTHGKWYLIATFVAGLIPFTLIGTAIGMLGAIHADPTWPQIVLGGLIGAILGIATLLLLTIYLPLAKAKKRLQSSGFGACSGLTVAGSNEVALTDWLHGALQDIAFGSPIHPSPLTFGDLERPTNTAPPVYLRMVTTNLSMGRPHTLPELGMQAGFRPADWQSLFPAPVLAYLNRKSGPWNGVKGARRLPTGDDLPVICALRMSLSFPFIFKAIPILSFDHEFKSVVNGLGGTAKSRLCTIWLTDGGLSSNFPIHLFDSPLPARPTFAISLDKLQVPSTLVKRRAFLPQTSAQGSGVQIAEVNSLADFGLRILASAKDWQDQLASEITGQRERIARIFLDKEEGGLNLRMPESLSRSLMSYGLDAGRLFTSSFDFDEHRWRRTLGVYRNTGDWIDRTAAVWNGGFGKWFATYEKQVKSYKKLTQADRKLMARQVGQLATASSSRPKIKRADDKFPGNTGQLRVTGRY
jgi:predicted acylesterase/phospholipase RssA